jgi:hypothetical protein
MEMPHVLYKEKGSGSYHDFLPIVSKGARVGSPEAYSVEKGFSLGTKLSLEMAWRSRGAEMRLSRCRPAPVVASMKLPIRMTNSLGQAKLATTKLPPMLCLNLYNNNI